MRAASKHSRKQVFDEINITPLTDIFLVLLIIMMVVAPMVQQMRRDIRPPDLTSGATVAKDQVTVDITKEGKYYVDGVKVGGHDIDRALRDAAAGLSDDHKKLTIRADRAAKGHMVMLVLKAAKDDGFKKISFVGEVVAEHKPGPQP